MKPAVGMKLEQFSFEHAVQQFLERLEKLFFVLVEWLCSLQFSAI